jgi:hypothetical protein
MKRVYRLAITAVSTAVIAVLTTAAAFAAGYLGPGHYATNFADASGTWFTSGFASVTVDRNTFVFRGHNGTSYMQDATILMVQLKTPTVLGFDCFLIPDQDFVESNGVQAASLNATGDSSNLCPDFATPLPAVLSGSGGKGGGPGPGGNIQLPLTVTLSWAGNGTTSTSSDQGTSSCGGFSGEFHSHMSSAAAAATGALTFGDGSVMSLTNSDSGSVDSGSFTSNMQGYPSPACFGK